MLHPTWLHPAEHEGDNDVEAGGYKYRWYALGVICLALLIGQVDVTIVNLALPSIATDLDASTSDLQWVMDAYSIALAGFVLFGGGLADRYGRKGVFMWGLALFGVASFVALFSTEAWHLIASRGAMGLGAALFFPPALSLMAVLFAPAERGKAVAIWAATGGIGTVIGPILGGILVDEFWWGSVLAVNIPIAVVGIVGAALLLPRSRRPGAPSLDKVGALLSVVGLALFIFGVIEGPSRGWSDPLIVFSLVFGAAVIAGFIVWEWRREEPMVDVKVFRHGGVAGGGLGLTTNLLTMTGILFLLPMYLQSVEGVSATTVGVLLIPFGLTFMILAFVSKGSAERFGVRPVLTGGLLVMGLGTALLALLVDVSGHLIVLAGTMIFGAGAAYVAPPATAAVMNALPTEKAGDASAVNQITRQVGAAFGVAIVGTVLASVYTTQLEPATADLSDSQTVTAEASITGAQEVAGSLPSGGDQLLDAANTAFADGYRTAMLVLTAIAFLTAVFVWFAVKREDHAVGADR